MNVSTNHPLKSTMALAALKQVTDPEIGLNVVDLGLIYQLDFAEAEKKIYVTMTLTTPFCPMGESITGAVKRALENTFAGEEVVVALSYHPPWRYECMSEEGRKYLNR